MKETLGLTLLSVVLFTSGISLSQDVESVVIPDFSLNNATLVDAVKEWGKVAKKLDPEKEGLSYHVMDLTEPFSKPPRVTLRLKNVSVKNALEEICKKAGASANWAYAQGDVQITRVHTKEDEPKLESWTNNEGRTIEAYLVRVDGDSVILKLKNNREVAYPIANLSPETKKKIKQ